MRVKKNRKADLERKRFAFFQIGLIVVGSLTLAAFEYTTVQVKSKVFHPLPKELFAFTAEPDKEYVVRNEPVKKVAPIIDLANVDSLILVDKRSLEGERLFVENKVPDKVLIGGEDYGGEVSYGKPIIPSGYIEDVPDIDAEFIGGYAALTHFISANINLPNNYSGLERGGTVIINFVVNTDGSIEQVNVLQHVNHELDAAAVNVVKKMPKWRPGETAGKPVRVRFILPIKIVL